LKSGVMVMGRSSSVRRPSGRIGRVLYVKRPPEARRSSVGRRVEPGRVHVVHAKPLYAGTHAGRQA
jgi:hypothetical protein